jgi:hypothetical protein
MKDENMRKLLRTLQVQFPYLLDAKFKLMRLVRNGLNIPFEYDFNALSLFPEEDDALFLDVGANRGQSTDAILMKRKNVRIHQFEPNKLLFEKLKGLYGRNERIMISNMPWRRGPEAPFCSFARNDVRCLSKRHKELVKEGSFLSRAVLG